MQIKVAQEKKKMNTKLCCYIYFYMEAIGDHLKYPFHAFPTLTHIPSVHSFEASSDNLQYTLS